MIQRISTDYKKEHCTCYDELIRNKVVAIMIVPDSEYKLRYTDNENIYDVSGFALININAIDTLNNYAAVDVSLELPIDNEDTQTDIIKG